jgi:hypothetical protein
MKQLKCKMKDKELTRIMDSMRSEPFLANIITFNKTALKVIENESIYYSQVMEVDDNFEIKAIEVSLGSD